MRKNKFLVFAILFVMAFSVMNFSEPVYAALAAKAFRGAITASRAIAQGATIVGVQVVCSGTACVSSISDSATLGGETAANTVWEGGAAASASAFTDFRNNPLVTTTGSSVVLDANTTSLVIYVLSENP